MTEFQALQAIYNFVQEQAAYDGLWSVPVDRLQAIGEASLQLELRKLHAVIESAFEKVKGLRSKTIEQGEQLRKADEIYIKKLEIENARLRESLIEIIAISDRKHSTWDKAKAALEGK